MCAKLTGENTAAGFISTGAAANLGLVGPRPPFCLRPRKFSLHSSLSNNCIAITCYRG